MLIFKPPVFLVITILTLIALGYLFIKYKKKNQSDLIENTNTTDLTLESARIITFFGATIIPIGGIVYYALYHGDWKVTVLHFILGIILYIQWGLSYFIKIIKNRIQSYIQLNFFIVITFYQVIIYSSNLEPYFIISLILALTTGGAIIYSIRIYITMSVCILIASSLIAFLVSNPNYDISLFLFATLSSCSVGILILSMRLSLSKKLIFSDTIVNKSNSIVIVSNKQGKIIYISQNITEILGYETEEVMGDGWWQLTTMDQGTSMKNKMFQSEEKKQTYQRKIKHKDGSFRWIQWNDKRYSEDLIFGIGTDVTKEKEYQERFEYIVNNANDLIYTTNANGNFTFANEMVLKITERNVEEFLNLNFLDIVAPTHKRTVKQFYLQAVKQKLERTYHEFPIINKSNEIVWVGQSVTNKFNEITKKYEGTEVICRNITERILIQNKLDDNNKQLSLLNSIKEKILYAKSIEEVSAIILNTIIASATVTEAVSIHLNNDWQKNSYVFLSKKSNGNEILNFDVEYEDFQSIEIYFPNIISERELYLVKEELAIWEPLFFYNTSDYSSSLIVPVVFESKIIGFLNLFSNQTNVYHAGDSFLLNDIANSVNAFLTSFKQKQIIEEKNSLIEKNNQHLDLLNKSKQSLLQANTIDEVHKELILVLTTNIKNIDRVSTCHFNFDKNKAQLYFLNTSKNNEIDSKIISISEVSTIETLKQNKVYYKPNFDTETELNEDDKHWYSVGIRSVLCAPIFINNKLHSCINLLSNQPNNFDENYLAIINEIVSSTSITFEQINYKNIINEKNKDITDNITYAKRIQDAIMPKLSVLQNTVPESFLFFSQKDVLGGDFYWFDNIEDKTYIVVGDCTGHGVSGALLSILASDIIKQAVLELRLTDPGMILQHLNYKILSTLNQHTHNTTEENEIVDGLDISFAVINHQQNSIYFSGAMHNAYIIRENELIELKGNRKPIGVSYPNENNFFGTHVLSLKKNDLLYFFTDGYCDQFHYQTSKKFGKIQFRELLLKIRALPFSEQYQQVLETHKNWKGELEQTDDICVIGLKF